MQIVRHSNTHRQTNRYIHKHLHTHTHTPSHTHTHRQIIRQDRKIDATVFLFSFPACYAAEFAELKTTTKGGVPLEHVISCVPGVQVMVSKSGIKKVQWAENKVQPQHTGEMWWKLCRYGESGADMVEVVQI